MLWLRGLVLLIGKFVGGFFMLAFVLIGGVKLLGEAPDIPWTMPLFSFALGVGIFMLTELYDQILLKLNPTGQDLTLFK